MKAINRNSLAAGLVATMSLALAAPAYARGPMPDPAVKEFQRLVDAAYAKYKGLQDGKNADYIPILTETPSDWEPYEGCLLELQDVTITSAVDAYGQASTSYGAFIDDLLYTPTVSNGDVYSAIRGPLYYSYSEWKVEPEADGYVD